MTPERELQHEIRLAVGSLPDVCIWRNETGQAKHIGPRGRPQHVRYGLCVGSADLIGVGPGGRFLALEIKTETGRVTPEQTMFLDLVRSKGGIAAVVRSVDEALAVIEAARS